MYGRLLLASSAASVLALAVAAPASAEVRVKLEEVASGLTHPLAMVQPPGDDRRFIIEQDGRIRILTKEGDLLSEPFLDIRSRLKPQWADFDEKGLLGIAFHPDFQQNGKFYIAYSQPINFQDNLAKQFWWSHTNVVAEYTVSEDDPDKADARTERLVSSIDWPQFNHNGHWIGFGPDNMLYLSTGDGGYANDWGIGHNVTEGNGQDLTSPHGKILRIDVDGEVPDNPFAGNADALPEIWAYGLRNPWRCSFDMGGDNELFCGDVQQNSYEEVNIIHAGDNLGWRVMEASHCFDYTAPDAHPAQCDKEGLKEPILEYQNCTAKPDGCKGISITGGYVYRGSHQDWDGKYIFGDWSKGFGEMDGQLFMATKGEDGNWTMEDIEVTNMEGNLPYVLAFAQDADGEVYALTSISTGPVGKHDKIFKITPAD
ncbi:MAG TPA: PQQ-dependent sugar dehydrogenase [Geminicoccaceae bacterium]|nr:PQQ-dependent sugar dehydrogenase [Geminicoccaceae bacterium]